MKRFIERIIFESRWLLILFYLGLILGILAYTYVYAKTTYELVQQVGILDKEGIMVTVLELLDMVMVANLVKFIMTGSYNSFVSKDHGYKNENISSGTMKVKMATSLIGVSSIHLLQTFIHADVAVEKGAVQNWNVLLPQLAIHLAFILGALALVIINKVQGQAELLDLEVEEKEEKHFDEHNQHKGPKPQKPLLHPKKDDNLIVEN